MRKKLGATIASCAVLLLASGTARAAPIVPGGSGLDLVYAGSSCSDCSAEATFLLLSATSLEITLTNTSGDDDNNWLTQLHVLTDPDIQVQSATFNKAGWGFADLNGNQWSFRVDTNQGVNNALDQGETLTVTLTFEPSVTSLDIVNSQIHWQNTTNSADSDKGTGTPPPTSVPEPTSALLFGVGIAAAGWSRRRQRLA